MVASWIMGKYLGGKNIGAEWIVGGGRGPSKG
jgi:hypothetical protein